MCQPAGPPHGDSIRLARLGRLPQAKSTGRLAPSTSTRTGAQLVDRTGQKVGHRARSDRPGSRRPVRGVGHAAIDQPLDERDDVGDVGRHKRLHVRRQHAEAGHVAVVLLGEAGRQIERRLADLVGTRDDLVVHVGDVADEVDLVAEPGQAAPDDVEADGRVGMADMRRVVRRRPAEIDRYRAGLERLERQLLLAEGVVERTGGSARQGARRLSTSRARAQPRHSARQDQGQRAQHHVERGRASSRRVGRCHHHARVVRRAAVRLQKVRWSGRRQLAGSSPPTSSRRRREGRSTPRGGGGHRSARATEKSAQTTWPPPARAPAAPRPEKLHEA